MMTTTLKSNLCDYSDLYILVKGTITIKGAGADRGKQNADARNKQVTFKNRAPSTICTTETSNTHVDNAKDLDVVMLMYNLVKYSHSYVKASGSLLQYRNNVQ